MRTTFIKFGLSIGLTFAAGLLGAIFIDTRVGDWYGALNRPAFAPSLEFIFLVYVVLYALMAIACAIIWLHHKAGDDHAAWVRFYFIHLLLNAGWVMFFFGFHAYWLAFFDMLVLMFFVFGLMIHGYGIDRRATYLFIPYMLWILFAIYLTMQVWQLN